MNTAANTLNTTAANIVEFPVQPNVAELQAKKDALIAAQKELAKQIAQANKQNKKAAEEKQNAGQTAALSEIVAAVAAMLAQKGLSVADLRSSEAFKTFIGQDKREIRKMTPADEKFITACLMAGIPVSAIATELDTAQATIVARKEKMVGIKFPVLTAQKTNGDTWTAGDKGQWPESAKTMVREMIETIKSQLAAEAEASEEQKAEDAPF